MDSDMNLEKVKDILKNEINTLEEYLTYQEEKNKQLKDSLNNISKYIDEDERIIDAARDFIQEHDFGSDSKVAEEEIDKDINEVYSKMEILHSQLCNLTKKFVNVYCPQTAEGSAKKTANQALIPDKCSASAISGSLTSAESITRRSTEKNTPKKSLLEILEELMYDLNPNSVKEEYGIMIVDDTVRFSDIEFLLSAGIVKQSPTNPACIKLTNRITKS